MNLIQKFTFAVQRWSACSDKEKANQLNAVANELIAQKSEIDQELVSAAQFFANPDFWNKFEAARENVNRVQKWITQKMNWLTKEVVSAYGRHNNNKRI